jgi:hypothetical protein
MRKIVSGVATKLKHTVKVDQRSKTFVLYLEAQRIGNPDGTSAFFCAPAGNA